MKLTACLPLVSALGLVALPLGAAPTNETAGHLGSRVFAWEELAVKKSDVGERRDVADEPTQTLERFECHISTLNPGLKSHPPHRHPQEEFIIIREGSLDVTINGETQRVGPGSLFFFAANDWHNVSNPGDVPATYLVFNLASAATRSAPAEGAGKQVPPGTLGSNVYAWERLMARRTATGEIRDIGQGATVACRRLEMFVETLAEGSSAHPRQRHAEEEVLAVKSGTLAVTINGETRTIGPGSICFFASNDDHAITNAGKGEAAYYIARFETAATPVAQAN
ncbi:MAG TPA: cupin domain-containing protein [Opitutaceae bacterium]